MMIKVSRSIDEPIRDNPSFEERWKEYDKGLITAWEVGREKAINNPSLIESIKKNELPPLGWDGGHKKHLKSIKFKYGVLHYLAQWQGVRGDDLDIDSERDEGKEMICSKTNMKTIFTSDINHFRN